MGFRPEQCRDQRLEPKARIGRARCPERALLSEHSYQDDKEDDDGKPHAYTRELGHLSGSIDSGAFAPGVKIPLVCTLRTLAVCCIGKLARHLLQQTFALPSRAVASRNFFRANPSV